MKKIIFFISLFFTLMLLSALDSRATTLAEADSAYSKDNFNQAVELYNSAIAQGERSADVYYNLGNAYYRQGHPGKAIVAYERALRIDPANDDVRANLAFVRTQLGDMPEDDTSFLTGLHQSVVMAMSANAWAWLAFAAFVLLCGAVALYIFSGNVALRKIGFFGGIILIFITIYFIIVAAGAWARIDDHSEAVVTSRSTTLNSQPRMPRQNEKTVQLNEGAKVEVKDSVATPDDPESPQWYNVKINNSTEAWLRATDVEKI